MRFDAGRALILYSGVVTLALARVLLIGASPPSSRFDTIDVHRINVREDDGTIRMVIASRDRFPGIIFRNREHPHPDRSDAAGMLFFNDEGTENGGLIFGGHRVAGKTTNFGHLSFDQYEQDQVINLEQSEEEGTRQAGLTIADYPDAPLDLDLGAKLQRLAPPERAKAIADLRARGVLGQRRLFIGKSGDRDAILALRDGEGRVRLRLRVTDAGAASIEFLDAAGRVVRTETAAPSAG
jgi:hypothetical protein